ncbi:TPA: hypothetical protein DCW38_06880 [candidate division WOR-3 bacterium]|jgi:REP element-mobilizing transposase RayT|uniref:Transposase IS200-like domain-containing protein n=1 Tax=candidate division WOR-3 bacterium TaxID=2052148 RepID=A0A350HBH2_UNCW3|nr:hypothetical protein [candidate division WOR-3 bacterium]
MRRARITYQKAYHHVMNRGINGEKIFGTAELKQHFIELLKELTKKFGIELYAYCLMDNHYHLVLRSTYNNLSAFMKELNGDYGLYYRLKMGGKGYVFQSRFKSTLIENDSYLRMAIIYTLLNPVRAGIEERAWEYEWSSASEYYKGRESEFVSIKRVEEIFGSKKELELAYAEWTEGELPVLETRAGSLLGTEEFIRDAIALFDRRKGETKANVRAKKEWKRDLSQILKDFEKEKGIKLEEVNFSTYSGKRIRAELLVKLKDEGGLTYKEISEIEYYKDLQLSSLGKTYKVFKEAKK